MDILSHGNFKIKDTWIIKHPSSLGVNPVHGTPIEMDVIHVQNSGKGARNDR
jgi:hypothetical protein